MGPEWTGKAIAALCVEDDRFDALLAVRQLKDAGFAVLSEIVSTRDDFAIALELRAWDVIIADYRMANWSGMDALEMLARRGLDIPFILLTGSLGEELAVECLRKGATDYVLKDRIARLPFAVARAIEERQERARRRAAEAQNALLAAAVEQAAEAIAVAGPDGRIQYVNRAFSAMTGYSREEAIGRDLLGGGRMRGLQRTARSALLAGSSWAGETVARRHDGVSYYAEVTISPIREADGSVARFVSIHQDITARRRAQKALARKSRELARSNEELGALALRVSQDLKDKQALLQELHHRVKNNLQVICSLMNLQSDAAADAEVRRILDETADRVRSMALVHEKLYRSADMASVDFRDYVESLADQLISAYRYCNPRVRILLDISDDNLPVDRAIPMGLIVNEVLTNALRHAFPDGRPGEIVIRYDAGDGLLSIRDNGVGMPAQTELRPSLGLELVRMLARQLKGNVEIRGRGGVEVVVRSAANAQRLPAVTHAVA